MSTPSDFTPEQLRVLEDWTRRYPQPEMGLVGALREVQRWHGCVDVPAERVVAGIFKVPLNRVHGVVTFYPYFTTVPAGRHRVCLCRNVSCQRRGADRMAEHLHARLGPEGKVSEDGSISWESVECLGACDHAPALAVDDELIGAASPEGIDRVLSDLRAGKTPEPAPIVPQAPVTQGPHVLTGDFGDGSLHSLASYRRLGGYASLEKAREMSAADITAEVKRSSLRGLGGAGFPAALKWETVPPKSKRQAPHYLVANADESEPGCFKDRVLMERNPHALIEGLAIVGKAIDADGLFIFIRGEYARQARILEAAAEEARAAGLLDRGLWIMAGGNAYISGCDTALLETMEGKKAWPRQPPPFPTVSGLYGNPTVVNNVETLMMVPAVLRTGGESFAKMGAPGSGGTCVFSVSGDVERPGVYEFPMGVPFPELLQAAGGMRGGKRLKALIPGGTSTPVLNAEEAMRVKMDFDSIRSLSSFLGAGGVVVLDETADMVEVLRTIEHFLWHESCGQCTPCREGSGWVLRILDRIRSGGGIPSDPDNLRRISENVAGRTICALGDTVGMVAKAMIDKFPDEFRKAAHG